MEASEILKKIRKIEITTKSIVSDIFSGEYHSIFKGQGLEFSEVREYQDGDAFRQIDWNVSAKMGKPYIKKFEETRELNVMFLIDGSYSTLFGTQNSLKSEYITEIAAVLSFSALSNNDKVGLLLFTDEVEKYIPPRKGRKSALRILREILYFDPASKSTDLKMVFEYIYRLTKKRSTIFIISDFFDTGYENVLKLLARKHDCIAIQVLDKAELELPKAGILDFFDPESGKKFSVNTSSKKVRKRYQEFQTKRQKQILENFRKMRIDMINLTTDKPYINNLIKFFKNRSHRKARR